MAWRLAKSLETLRSNVNAKWPNRSKDSDGTIGDESHQSSNSDHNPWVQDGGQGVVTAMDITHDPANGLSSQKLAEALIASRDPRIKYVISNRKIASSEASPWQWRDYDGKNPHNHHVHISAKSEKASYDFDRGMAARQCRAAVFRRGVVAQYASHAAPRLERKRCQGAAAEARPQSGRSVRTGDQGGRDGKAAECRACGGRRRRAADLGNPVTWAISWAPVAGRREAARYSPLISPASISIRLKRRASAPLLQR